MPFSGIDNIEPVINTIYKQCPEWNSALDIGVGLGQWGYLLRSWFDMANDRIPKAKWQKKIVGVEVFPQYKNPIWDLYTVVENTNAQIFLNCFDRFSNAPFDLAIMVEVLEHLTKSDAAYVLGELKKRCRHLIVSYSNTKQDSWGGNDHERHLSEWTPKEIKALLPGAEIIHSTGFGHYFYFKNNEALEMPRTIEF